jgi:signal transduction histidine kinase
MNTEVAKKMFEDERRETDDSLTAERAKATRSLDSASVKSQGQTDEIVKDERSIADQQTATSRANQDQKSETTRNGSVDTAAAAQLTEERRLTDVATGLERSRMDEVLLAERKSASTLVAKVLEQERIATDQNLLIERNTTDAECVGSSNLLKTEVAKHKKTQVALTSRDEFLAIVSHDLRNPIGAISGYAELILEGAKEKHLDPEITQYVRAMKRNSDIAIRLIADLLDLERIAANKLTMSFAKCDASGIAHAVVDVFTPLAFEKKVTIISELPKGALEFECDHDRTLQVISNLMGNALKYSPAGGTVTLSVNEQKDSIEFVVKDSGAGIPKEKQSEIFKRFAQLTSMDRTGLGLGLYIARTIVDAHSGSIEVSSEPGMGSTFRVSIPKLITPISH